jgi:hypothetical protein
MTKKRHENKTTHGFGCYKMPVGITFTVRKYADVLKEGGEKKFCRACVRLVVQDFREQVEKTLREMGMV